MRALGLDLDGCLYDWHESVYNYFVQFKKFDGSQSDFWNNYRSKISEDEWRYLVEIDTLYSNTLPTPECMDFLDKVKSEFDLYYITGRPDSVRLTTEQYLKRNNFPQHENLFFEKDKVNRTRQLKIEYFLEDLPHHVESLSRVTNVIMYARPWNKELWDKYPTARSFKDVLKFMEI